MSSSGQERHIPANHWLTRQRFAVYPKLVVALFVVTSVVWLLRADNGIDATGKPLGYDFITFWSASHLALAGRAADAYDLWEIARVERLTVPASGNAFAWFYPPSFYLLIAPLALLPYLTSYVVFMASTLAVYVAVFRQLTRDRRAMWALAAFPGLWMNLLGGQNAFFTAALAAGALLCLQRAPTLAGVLIGCLLSKPHLAVLLPSRSLPSVPGERCLLRS